MLFLVGVATADSNVSKKELYSRARDVLKESLENGDTAKGAQAFEYLRANIENGAPLIAFEEYLVSMELGRYEEGIKLYAGIRKIMLDSSATVPKETRASADDALNRYLYRNLSPYTKQVADSLYARVEASDISKEYKDLYRTMLYSELVLGIETFNYKGGKIAFKVVRDTTCAEEFLTYAKDFTAHNSLSEHAFYLKEQVIPPLQKYMDELREFRKNPLKHKYYSGGIGAYWSAAFGGYSGKIGDVYESRRDGDYVVDVDLRFKRLYLNAHFGEQTFHRAESSESYDWDEGLSISSVVLGVNVFDCRFVRVTPFLGMSELVMDHWSSDVSFTLGTNLDLRLGGTTPKRIGDLDIAFLIRLKYMAHFAEFSLESDSYPIKVKDGDYSGILHTFSVGFGIELW